MLTSLFSNKNFRERVRKLTFGEPSNLSQNSLKHTPLMTSPTTKTRSKT